MKRHGLTLIAALLCASPALAQDGEAENIVVTGSRIGGYGPVAVAAPEPRPVIGLRRQADSALRHVELTSDSLDDGMRRREVRAMLLDAIDRAGPKGFSIVTGRFTVTEVTRANWQDLFPDLARGSASDYADDDDSWQTDDEDEDEDYDEDSQPKPFFEDDGSTTTLRLMVKTRLSGTIDDAERKISAFVKSVPENGRAQMKQKGALSLTIIRPEQYRDEIYALIAAGAQHAASFYGPEYGLEVTRLDSNVAWEQVSDTELFVFIRYDFVIKK